MRRTMGGSISVNTCSLDNFEGLQHAIQGSHVEVMQLGRGKCRGSLSHVGIGDFSLSIGSFSVGVRTQRVATDDKLVIGMLLNASERVTHWSFDMNPGDVLVMPPSTEHDGSFHGAAGYAAIRLDLAEVATLFSGEPRLSDPETWCRKNRLRADSPISLAATRRLPQIVSRLAQQQAAMSDEVADFWKRSIIDAVTATIVDALPADARGPVPSAMRLVRNVEHYLDTAGSRPVHVSEICAQFNVSRRSLHRAFDDMLGSGAGHFPPSQAPLRGPFRTAGQQSRDDHDRRDRHAAWLYRARALLSLLPVAVWRISFGNALFVETHFSRESTTGAARHGIISTPLRTPWRFLGWRPHRDRRYRCGGAGWSRAALDA